MRFMWIDEFTEAIEELIEPITDALEQIKAAISQWLYRHTIIHKSYVCPRKIGEPRDGYHNIKLFRPRRMC